MPKRLSMCLSITSLLYVKMTFCKNEFFCCADLMFCRTFTSVHFIVQTSCLSINLNNILFRNCGAMEMTCVPDCHCCETPSPTSLPFPLSRPSQARHCSIYLHTVSLKSKWPSPSPSGQVPPERRPFLPAGILTVNLSLRDFWELCQIFPPWIAF